MHCTSCHYEPDDPTDTPLIVINNVALCSSCIEDFTKQLHDYYRDYAPSPVYYGRGVQYRELH